MKKIYWCSECRLRSIDDNRLLCEPCLKELSAEAMVKIAAVGAASLGKIAEPAWII